MERNIKKRYANEINVDWSCENLGANHLQNTDQISYEGYDQAYLFADNKKIIQAFIFKEEGKFLVLPEPHPIRMCKMPVQAGFDLPSGQFLKLSC